jgi:hypothetical protein
MPKVYRTVPLQGSRQAVLMVQIVVGATFLIPTDTVIRVIGAAGYLANLMAMLMFVAWVLSAIFGFHDPLHTRHPTRGVLGFFWISTLLSFAAMPLYLPDDTQRLAAQRWMMLWVGISGVILVIAEHVRAPSDLVRIVRFVVWGAAFSGAVAVLQFWGHWDIKPYIRMVMVGFERNGDYSGFQSRAALTRVTGMANHPIEFAVVAGMLLPLAIWLGMHDREKSSMRRWLPVALITMSIPMSVSRSGILAAITSLTLFTVLLPATQRVWLLAVTPVAAVAVFVSTPGYLRTIFGSFTGAQSDASVLNRVNNYPRVIAAFEKAPWIGHGPNTDIQVDLTKVLDNQYLKSSIELGGLGVLALCLYFLVPALTALWARSRTSDPRFRALCAALAGGSLAAGVGSYTFDAFSFAQFASVDAIVVGLCGACWLLTQREPQAFQDSTAESAPPEPWSPKVSAVSAGPIPSPAK